MGNGRDQSTWADAERRCLRNLYQIVGLLREQDKEMPVQQMQVLFYIALNEGCTQRELCRDLDNMPVSTASRNIAALSVVHRLGKPGLGLITWVEDPEDRRAKLLALTVKGRSFMHRLCDYA